jgi:hypothetical protein
VPGIDEEPVEQPGETPDSAGDTGDDAEGEVESAGTTEDEQVTPAEKKGLELAMEAMRELAKSWEYPNLPILLELWEGLTPGDTLATELIQLLMCLLSSQDFPLELTRENIDLFCGGLIDAHEAGNLSWIDISNGSFVRWALAHTTAQLQAEGDPEKFHEFAFKLWAVLHGACTSEHDEAGDHCDHWFVRYPEVAARRNVEPWAVVGQELTNWSEVSTAFASRFPDVDAHDAPPDLWSMVLQDESTIGEFPSAARIMLLVDDSLPDAVFDFLRRLDDNQSLTESFWQIVAEYLIPKMIAGEWTGTNSPRNILNGLYAAMQAQQPSDADIVRSAAFAATNDDLFAPSRENTILNQANITKDEKFQSDLAGVEADGDGWKHLTVGDNSWLYGTWYIPPGVKLALNVNGKQLTRGNGFYGPLFVLDEGSELMLWNGIVQGASAEATEFTGSLFDVGTNATLTLGNKENTASNGVTLQFNRKKGNGAGIHNRGRVKMFGSRITRCECVDGFGGGIYNGPHAHLEVLGSTFGALEPTATEEQNKATCSSPGSGLGGLGGGIYNEGIAVIRGRNGQAANVIANHADGFGGGIYNLGRLTVGQGSETDQVCIGNNTARGNGGDIFNAGKFMFYGGTSGPKPIVFCRSNARPTTTAADIFIQNAPLSCHGQASIPIGVTCSGRKLQAPTVTTPSIFGPLATDITNEPSYFCEMAGNGLGRGVLTFNGTLITPSGDETVDSTGLVIFPVPSVGQTFRGYAPRSSSEKIILGSNTLLEPADLQGVTCEFFNLDGTRQSAGIPIAIQKEEAVTLPGTDLLELLKRDAVKRAGEDVGSAIISYTKNLFPSTLRSGSGYNPGL